MDIEERKQEPCYAVIDWHRVTASGGKARLFGSELEHHEMIAVRIKRAELFRSTHRDWVFPRESLIEVYLSPAQFTAFLTTPNSGPGTQCTLAWLTGEGSIDMPEADSRYDVFKEEIAEDMAELKERAAHLTLSAKEMLDQKTIKKADFRVIVSQIERIVTEVFSNIPFLKKSIEEHMEQTKARAKEEMEAYVESRIRELGVEALRGNAPQLRYDGEAVEAGIAEAPIQLESLDDGSLAKALDRISSMCGDPDPQRALRNILDVCREARGI